MITKTLKERAIAILDTLQEDDILIKELEDLTNENHIGVASLIELGKKTTHTPYIGFCWMVAM